MLNPLSSYTRKNNVLYEITTTGYQKPVVKFKQYFPDLKTVNSQTLDYLQKYMSLFPELCEILEPQAQKNNVQLSIFD